MKYKLITNVFQNGIIELSTILEHDNGLKFDLNKWVLDTQKEEVKAALVKLGWTPPKPKKLKNRKGHCCDNES